MALNDQYSYPAIQSGMAAGYGYRPLPVASQAGVGGLPMPGGIPGLPGQGGGGLPQNIDPATLQKLVQYFQSQQGKQQPAPTTSFWDAFGKGSAGKSAAGAGSGAASGGSSALAASPEANAAYNAAAMEEGGAPMTLADSGAVPASGLESVAGTAVPLTAVALGTYLAGKSALNMVQGKSDNSGQGKLGRAQLAITTGGLSEVGKATGLFDHKTTKQTEADRWGGLQDAGVQGAAAAEAANHPDGDTGVWQTGKYAGQKWSFDKALDLAKDDPTNFQKVEGNYDADNTWDSLSDSQQKEAVKRAVASGLYSSNKGDVVVNDKDAFGKIVKDVQGGTSVTQQPKSSSNPPPVPRNGNDPGFSINGNKDANTLPFLGGGPLVLQNAGYNGAVPAPRAPTTPAHSPGFDKNGKRINYSTRK